MKHRKARGGHMSGQLVRQKFMRQFVGMPKYSRWTAWLLVFFYLVQALVGIFVGHYLLSFPLSGLTVGLMILTSLFIGTRLRGLNNIVHECTHSTFSDYRSDNELVGKFCSSLLTGCYKQYKADHLSHHAHLGNYDQDRELAAIEKFRLHDPLSTSTILRHIATPLLGRHLKMYSGINLSGGDGAFFLGLKIVLLITISLFAIFYPYTAIFFVLLPLFYIFPTLNFWTDCLDHAGIVGAEDELEASRNVLAPLPLRLLLFPRNDCFHLVHHLFPQVPARHLETAHELLSEDTMYRNQRQAVGSSHYTVSDLATDAS